MTRAQTMVQLTDELVRLLDEEASRRGESRSALIRSILEAYLAESREASIGRQLVDGYTRMPPATPDEWGDPQILLDRSTADLLQRLDAEEREAGHEPW